MGGMAQEYVLRPFGPPARLRIDYERELNPQQLEAVTSPPGPALVIAGAGSGKTRTLTYRVAFLLEQGVPPDRILLLTFTNKAAREMLQRVESLLGRLPGALWGGTFHAIGHRVLRLHADRLGYEPNFGILDREDARHLLSTCIRDALPENERKKFPRAEVLAEIYSLAANLRLSIPEVLDRYFDYFLGLTDRITQIQPPLRGTETATRVMDFDDLLVRWLEVLEQQADLRDYWQRRFLFILVDEYQDTNVVQSAIVDLLAARHRNLMVVGDDAQSIYGWRGADARNILEFPNRYPGARVFKIETNYRSTPEILEVANAVILGNRHQFHKELTAVRPSGPRPAVVACTDASQQAAFVAQRVAELHEAGTPLDRMAVLYRAHHHALELQMELTRRGIPLQHHQRRTVPGAGPHERRHRAPASGGESAGQRRLPAGGADAAGDWCQGGRPLVGDLSIPPARRLIAAECRRACGRGGFHLHGPRGLHKGSRPKNRSGLGRPRGVDEGTRAPRTAAQTG
ncbi:MAG: hypothetical protein KatS3mg132_649 [Limisphaera sp.]|nr:MAG: hypothetical protein KatS3mg132_649 [Limisphaera sp.]